MRVLRTVTTAVSLVCIAATLGCAEGQLLDTKTKHGAVIGTLAGAAAGAAIGGKKHRAGGALIGAARRDRRWSDRQLPRQAGQGDRRDSGRRGRAAR